MSVKGYKVFNPDWTCRDFQYEVGKTYKHEGKIGLCGAGFHFCKNLSDCFNYYPFQSTNKVAEVEVIGEVMVGEDKCVTDEIVIVKELSWYEVLDLVNSGNCNSGYHNSGNYNSGNCNSGNCNSGNYNSGNYNSGYHNSGNCNSGNYNSGNCNSGNCNSGYHNSGDCNSGDCNSGDHNSGNYNSGNCNSGNCNSTDYSTGFFNSAQQPVYAFNKPLKISIKDFYNKPGVINIHCNYQNVLWISVIDMTNEEKEAHPDYKTFGGYYKVLSYKEAWNHCWNSFSDEEKEEVKNIPNFDPIVFEEITGINVIERRKNK